MQINNNALNIYGMEIMINYNIILLKNYLEF